MTDRPDLEDEINRCDWLVAKIRADKSYAQNVYAALCNMQWQKVDVFPILKDETWSCTWRYAGGLVASIEGHGGDYMDWYCSGIRGDDGEDIPNYVGEGHVSDRIREDFAKLGWQPVPYDDKDMV